MAISIIGKMLLELNVSHINTILYFDACCYFYKTASERLLSRCKLGFGDIEIMHYDHCSKRHCGYCYIALNILL